MVSSRIKRQLGADVTNLVGAFQNNKKADVFNMGLGEIQCMNTLLDELTNRDDLFPRIIRSLTSYPGCQGYMPLNEKLCDLVKLETGLDIKPEDIILTSGAHDGLAHACHTYADVNEPVLYPTPGFPYWAITQRTQTQGIPLVCSDHSDFTHRISELVAAHNNPSLVIINSPHNPFGTAVSDEQAKALGQSGVRIVLDDVYRSFTKSWIGSHMDSENLTVVDSFSKRFGLPGVRVGFTFTPEVKHFRASVANQYTGINMASVILCDALLELYLEKPHLHSIPKEVEKRQSELNSSLTRIKHHGFKSPEPDGGIYRILYCNDSEALAAKMMEEKVKVVPSTKLCAPSVNSSQFVRLCIGAEHRIDEAVQKMDGVFEKNPHLL